MIVLCGMKYASNAGCQVGVFLIYPAEGQMPKPKVYISGLTCYELMQKHQAPHKHPIESFMHACARCLRARTRHPIDPDCQIYNKLLTSILPKGKTYDQTHWTKAEVAIVDEEPSCLKFVQR